MTSTELSGVVATATAKLAAVEAKGASYIPQILDAHQKVIEAEKLGHQRSLDAAIACGQLLLDAKDAIKGKFGWTEWRAEHLSRIPQTTASLYMRLAKNKDRLKHPDLKTDDGKRISNGLLILGTAGELSIRKAAGLLADKRPRGAKPQAKKTDLDIVKQQIKEVLAADELVEIAKQARDTGYIKEMVTAGLEKLHDDTDWLKALVASLTEALRPPSHTTDTAPAAPSRRY